IAKGDTFASNGKEAVVIDPNMEALNKARGVQVFMNAKGAADMRTRLNDMGMATNQSDALIEAVNNGTAARVNGSRNNLFATASNMISALKQTVGGNVHGDAAALQAKVDKVLEAYKDDPQGEAFRQFFQFNHIRSVAAYLNEVGGKRISNFELDYLKQ